MRYPFNQLCYIAGILMIFMTLTEILRLTVVLPRSRRTAAVVTKVRPAKPEDLSRRKAAGPGKRRPYLSWHLSPIPWKAGIIFPEMKFRSLPEPRWEIR